MGVLSYAIIGTWLTHVIGKPLIGLNFSKERVEADFRFSLARLREYPEQIALLEGRNGRTRPARRKASAPSSTNYLQISQPPDEAARPSSAAYQQAQVVFPLILGAPSYFLGKITLGAFQQTIQAFASVASALAFFITPYQTLATYKATLDRLTTFRRRALPVEESRHQRDVSLEHRRRRHRGRDAAARHSDRAHHRLGRRPQLKPGEATLIGGPSGCGKTTLFRALAGIWPFAKGKIRLPKGARVMLLPQKPYIPLGTLTGAIAYPAHDDTYSPEQDPRGADDGRPARG